MSSEVSDRQEIAQWHDALLYATRDDVILSCKSLDLRERQAWKDLQAINRGNSFCSIFIDSLSILYENDDCRLDKDEIRITHSDFYQLYRPEFGLSEFLPKVAPVILKIGGDNWIGSKDFRFITEFICGLRRATIRRLGAFAFRGKNFYILDQAIYQSLVKIDEYMSLAPEMRSSRPIVLGYLSALQKSAREENIRLEKELREQEVVVVNRVYVDVAKHTGKDQFSLVPYFPGVSREKIKEQFFRRGHAVDAYSLRTESSHTWVVPTDEVRRAVSLMYRLYRSSKRRMRLVLEDPLRLFAAADCLEVVDLSGIEAFLSQRIKEAADEVVETEEEGAAEGELYEATESRFIESERITEVGASFETFEHYIDLNSTPKVGVEQSDDQPLQELERVDTDADFFKSGEESDQLVLQLPVSLVDKVGEVPFSLKKHQCEGIAWMQRAFSRVYKNQERSGVLLADDMGLGKTVQVLTFIAWFLSVRQGLDDDRFKGPVLIVAPVSLLSVWQTEMRKFFFNDGQVFQPSEVLHGEGLNKYRRNFEEKDGSVRMSLDPSLLGNHTLLITNYETITHNYEAVSDIDWSIVVTDESQRIKDYTRNVSKCIGSLNRAFSLAITGTPVENELLDLWSIMSFVDSTVFPDVNQFKRDFQVREEDTTESLQRKAERLRECLKFNTADSLVLRRTKEGVLDDLPKREEFIRLTPLTGQQVSLHKEIMTEMKASEHRDHLKWFGYLQKIYQHVALRNECGVSLFSDSFLDESIKLRDLINLLREIRYKGDKVLIFARYKDMQLILKRAIEEKFGIIVDIINGDSKTGNARKRIIRDFEAVDGFNCLILSPKVAGVGLTIVGANHVVHYGRWWNPAQEAQATDRVYRIGQEKKVSVYYLVSSTGEFPTLDERVHLSLGQKKELAKNFLIPSIRNTLTEKDIVQELLREKTSSEGLTEELNAESISGLSVHELEALTAVLWRRQAQSVFLLPKSFPQIARLIAIKRESMYVVACLSEVAGALGEIVKSIEESADYFSRQGELRFSSDLKCRPCLVTRGKVASKIAKDYQGRLLLWDGDAVVKMTKESKISWSDLVKEDMHRLQKLSDILHLSKT